LANTLTQDFVLELSKSCLQSQKILEICKSHLKYQYLENETQKKFFRYVFELNDLDSSVLPTFGILSQTFAKDEKFISLLSQIKKVRETNHEHLLTSLQDFIKEKKFRILYSSLGELFNLGKHDEAYQLLAQESTSINEFSLKETYYDRIFHDFETRHQERSKNADHSVLTEKCTYGIPGIDDATRGGFEYGTAICILARSGGGKSTYLKWIGLANARLGKKVVHFQAEGTKKEVKELYDSAWTSIDLEDIELGVLPESKRKGIEKFQRDVLVGGGEIFTYAKEQFDQMTMQECRDVLVDIESIYGKIDLVIFDYLEIFTVKGSYGKDDGSERRRRADLGNKIVNISTEFHCGVATAVQANDIAPDFYNNPAKVLTRHHIAEFKAILNGFSAFLTLNSSDDEREEGVVRIYADKFRKHFAPSEPWTICSSLRNSRFFDAARTKELFG
jgi:hypothetical protein